MSWQPADLSAFIERHRRACQELATEYLDRLDRYLRSLHRPEEVGERSELVCFRCVKEWPCEEFVRVDERIRARQSVGEQP